MVDNTQIHLQDDCLPYLINISQQCNKLDAKQFTRIVNEFVHEIGASALISIIFNGLYNSNDSDKYEWISFLNDKLSQYHPDTNNEQTSKYPLLLQLHTDALTSICQFLTIQELSKLELCNTFLFGFIRNTPFCITTLNYPEWQSFWLRSNANKFHRLSNTKKVFLVNRVRIGNRDETIDLNGIASIMPNVTHLSANDTSIFDQCNFASLQSLTTFSLNLNHIVASSFNIDQLYQLSSLKLNKHTHSISYISSDSMKLLLSTKIKVLTFDVEDKYNLNAYQRGGYWQGYDASDDYQEPEDIWSENASLYRHLQHFEYDKGQINIPSAANNNTNIWRGAGTHLNELTPDEKSKRDIVLALSREVIRNCTELKVFGLVNITKSDYKVIFGESTQEIKWNCKKLQNIKLHVSSVRICEILQSIIGQQIPELQEVDILLWDGEIENELQDQENGYKILNLLRDLLSYQLRNNHKFRNIKLKCCFKFVTGDNYVNLIFLMLKHVLYTVKCKRKELNIELKLVYIGFAEVPNYYIIDKLFDILNDSIECFTLKISYDVSGVSGWFRSEQFRLWHQYFMFKQRNKIKVFLDGDTNWSFGQENRTITFTNAGMSMMDSFDTDMINLEKQQLKDDENICCSNEELRYSYNQVQAKKAKQTTDSVIYHDASFDEYPIVIQRSVIDINRSDYTILPYQDIDLCSSSFGEYKDDAYDDGLLVFHDQHHQRRASVPLQMSSGNNQRLEQSPMNIDLNNNELHSGMIIELFEESSNEWRGAIIVGWYFGGEYQIKFQDNEIECRMSLDTRKYRILYRNESEINVTTENVMNTNNDNI